MIKQIIPCIRDCNGDVLMSYNTYMQFINIINAQQQYVKSREASQLKEDARAFVTECLKITNKT